MYVFWKCISFLLFCYICIHESLFVKLIALEFIGRNFFNSLKFIIPKSVSNKILHILIRSVLYFTHNN